MLKNNQFPSGQCQQILFAAQKMVEIIGKDVPDAPEYASQLMGIWEIEKLYGQLQPLNEQEKRINLQKLDEAAGYFRAVATHIRVM